MAGKKIDAGTIVLKTTDGGSFKVTAAEAKKLTKQVDKLGGASQATDRRIKGVTGQSANASKNFSKQAQTMQGGIVAVYATIAAQIFAVSAAFQFLKSSFETRNLIEGQKAFGSVTGVAYQTLTHAVQDATDGMLEFKEAASSVAIGVAAGLAGGQLERLAGAAKNASLALGRDLTDSFNRLIRGVTKAEPELLDELGIILRLENATRNYALQVGKARDDLNAYERTQAVLNDVLDQAETKYGRIAEIMDPDSFALGQLTKEFDDIILTFQEFMVKALLPLISFFKDNAAALVAAMGLFVLPIINTLLPDLDKSLIKSQENMGRAMGGMKEAATDAGNEFRGVFAATKDVGGARTKSSTGLKDLGVKFKKDSPDQLNARQIAAYKRHMKEKTGIYEKFNLQEKAAFKRHLAMQEATLRKSGKIQVGIVQRLESSKQVAIKTTEMVFKAAEAAKLKAASLAASAMNKLMAFMGVVGMIMMVVAAVVQLFNWLRNLDEAAKKAREETEKLTGVMEGLDEELGRMAKVRSQGMLGLVDGIQQTNNALKSYDIKGKLADINSEMDKFQGTSEEWAESEFGKAAIAAASQLEKLAPEMDGYADAIANMDRDKLSEHKNKWYDIAVGIINASEALQRYQENQKAIDKQVEKTIGKMTKLPFQDILNPLGSAITDFDLALSRLNDRKAELATVVEGARGGANINLDAVQSSTKVIQRGNSGTASYQKNYKFDELAARENAENVVAWMREKGVDAANQKARLDTESGRTAAFESLGFKAGGWMQTGDLDQTNKFKTEEELINAIMLAQGIGVNNSIGNVGIADENEKAGAFNLEQLRNFGIGDPAEIAEAQKVLSDADKEIRAMVQANDNNKILQTEMLAIQEKSLDLDQKKIANSQALADAGIGSTRAVKVAKNLYKLEQAKEKKTKADIDARIAGTNKLLETSKFQQQMDNYANDNATELGSMVVDRAKVEALLKKRAAFAAGDLTQELTAQEKHILTNLENQHRAVENSETAVTNMGEQVTLQGQLVTNATEQNTWENKLLNIQERQVTAAYTKLDLQEKLNKLKRDENSLELYGYALAREKFANKGTSITERQTDQQTSLARVSENLKETGIDTTVKGFDPTVEAKDQKGVTQVEKGDTYLQEYLKLLEEGRNLEAESSNYAIERSKFATNLLATENELLNSKREQVLTLNPAQEIYNEKLLAHVKTFGSETGFNAEEVAKLAVEQANVNIELELMDGIQSTLKNGFSSMFQSLIDGSKSFKDSMKDLAKSVLADLAAMYMKAAALKFMLAFMPGGEAVTATLKTAGSRYGGEVTGPGYATGGIAHGPESGYQATLHGREAVVPLGNDRSIPVDIRGASGNTVNVSINMQGGQSQTSASGGGDMQALGRSIGGLVQQHLQTEMRPGGLLNRQGAKGRGG
jgi:hypothetical protein